MNILFGFFTMLLSQSTIYSIEVNTIEGSTTSLASFSGKKILISPFNASNPDTGLLRYLDSLQMSDTSLQVIAVPGNDLESEGNDTTLAALKDSLGLHVLLLRSTLVKKSAQENQNPLFKWLTDVNENDHFDVDVLSEGQMFIVSRSGILYSVVDREIPGDILNQILNQEVSE